MIFFRHRALSAGKEILLWSKSTKPSESLPCLVLEMLKELIQHMMKKIKIIILLINCY